MTADMSLMPSEGGKMPQKWKSHNHKAFVLSILDKSQSAEQTEQLCMSDQEGTPASRPSEAGK